MTHPSGKGLQDTIQIHDKMAISVGNVTIKLQNPGTQTMWVLHASDRRTAPVRQLRHHLWSHFSRSFPLRNTLHAPRALDRRGAPVVC